jgi:hypothetical protein
LPASEIPSESNLMAVSIFLPMTSYEISLAIS